MNLRSTPLLAFAALAACGQAPSETDAPAPIPRETAQSMSSEDRTISSASVESLAGEWRVAAIDGRSSDEPIGLALSADDGSLWWEPRCAGVERRYRIEERSIAISSTVSPAEQGRPKEICAIAQHPRLGEVTRALDSATTVARTANNGVLISSEDHSVTLFSQ